LLQKTDKIALQLAKTTSNSGSSRTSTTFYQPKPKTTLSKLQTVVSGCSHNVFVPMNISNSSRKHNSIPTRYSWECIIADDKTMWWTLPSKLSCWTVL